MTRRRVCVVLLMITLLLRTNDLRAQIVAQSELKFLPFQAELPRNPAPFADFWEGLKVLRDEESRQRAVNGSISIGFSGDQTRSDSLFKLRTGATLQRGFHPAELRFAANLSLQVKGTEFQEDVTQLVANYDYHPTGYSEYFAFVERFTDNFLGIQQRYETGFGFMLGTSLIRTPAWRRADGRLLALERLLPMVQTTLDAEHLTRADLRERVRPAATDYAQLRTALGSLRESLLEKESRLYLGLASSVFWELEQAKIEALIAPLPGAPVSTPAQQTKKAFPIGASHRLRWTIRPTAIVRPAEGLEISVYPYVKLPLGGPRHEVVDGEERLDYRFDLSTIVGWKLSTAETGSENLGFLLKIDHRFDNVPPRIPQGVIDAEARSGTVLTRTSAERSHSAVSLELSIKWGS